MILKKAFFSFCIFFLTLIGWSLEVPHVKGYVNDYADMISSNIEHELELKLKTFENTDSTQVVILTIPSLEEEVIEEFSLKVAETWKIGQNDKDNGVLFLVAKNDRAMRIEVGMGLEGVITDLLAGRIIDLAVAPEFKAGNIDAGFIAATDAIIDAAKGEFDAEKFKGNKAKRPFPIALLFIFFIIWINFSRRLPVPVRGIIGGILGAIVIITLTLTSGIHFGLVGLIMIALFGVGFGSIFSIIFSLLFIGSVASRSGGFFTTGGSSSGGFSGFSGGGGGFGGGGASGGW